MVAFNSFAGVCVNGSLAGAYNVNVLHVRSGQSSHGVGRVNFSGKGAATVSVVESVSGVAKAYTGSGTYAVTSACIATGTFNMSNGGKLTYWLYLDRMDTVPATNVAYHGNFVYKSTRVGESPASGSGTLDRVVGKF